MAAPSGTVWGSVVGGYGRLGLYITTSGDSTTLNVTTQIWLWTKYTVSDTNNTLYFDYGKTSATTNKGSVSIKTTVASGEGWSTTNQVKLATYTYSYSKTTSPWTGYCAAKLTNVDRVGGTMYVSGSFAVPAKTSYSVKYNANGGTGAPSAQTKWYGTTLKLQTGTPTRTGYSFQGWAISSSGSVAYAAGANYTANANVTLYAVWKANGYTVKYDANGGTGAPGNQSKTYGVDLTLSSTKPTRTNYVFKGWGTTKAATTVSYASGAKYTANANVTLYAIWELTYKKPSITNLKVFRCDTDGVISDDGTSFRLSFNWSCDQTIGNNPIKSAVFVWSGGTSEINLSVNTTATSGSCVYTSSDGIIDIEQSYDFDVKVTDSKNGYFSKKVSLSNISFPIDVLVGGRGIAFGKPAKKNNYADFDLRVLSTNDSGEAFEINHGTEGNESWYRATRSDKNTTVAFGVGSGGVNHGVWSGNIMTPNSDDISTGWMMYTGSDGYVKSNRKLNVLWSGAYFMHDTQSITLSDKISNQQNGIVLVFSAYTSPNVHNYEFNYTFVPKSHIALHPGTGVTCLMCDATGTYIGLRYLYVNDTTITGNAINDDPSFTASGINWVNTKWVLRYVIGV